MIANVTFDPAQFARHMRRLADGFIPAVKRGILSGSLRSLTVLDRRTRAARPANPSGLGSGTGAVDKGGGGGLIAQWKARPTDGGAAILNTAVYAPVVEWGRRLGAQMPPLQPIALWAHRKLGLSLEESKRAAFVIARAIKKRGLLPRLILTDAVPELEEIIVAEITRELTAEMRK